MTLFFILLTVTYIVLVHLAHNPNAVKSPRNHVKAVVLATKFVVRSTAFKLRMKLSTLGLYTFRGAQLASLLELINYDEAQTKTAYASTLSQYKIELAEGETIAYTESGLIDEEAEQSELQATAVLEKTCDGVQQLAYCDVWCNGWYGTRVPSLHSVYLDYFDMLQG